MALTAVLRPRSRRSEFGAYFLCACTPLTPPTLFPNMTEQESERWLDRFIKNFSIRSAGPGDA
jgi:hypothetical protein